MTIELLKQNVELTLKVKTLEKQVKTLKSTIKTLEKELNQSKNLAPNEFTLSQFVSAYLYNKFTIKSMPKRSGIYAYYNRKKSLLYVGQSVNMGNRLIQHFRNGKIKISGHDSEFNDEKEWEFYVLEYIDRNNKQLLDDREAYWIAMAKVASSQKTIINKKSMSQYEKSLKSGKNGNHLQISKKTKREAVVTNRTRGNNVRL